MNFTRMGDWYELSDCGCYTVACTRGGDEFKFHGWLLAPSPGKVSQLLGTFDKAEDARECCRQHREGAKAA